MQINYPDFKKECNEIVGAYLHRYGYIYSSIHSEEYINAYVGNNGIILISMLENFPHISVSFEFRTSNNKLISPRLLDKALKIDSMEKLEFYKNFLSKYDLNNYAVQMKYVVGVMEAFYRPILIEQIKLDDIVL